MTCYNNNGDKMKRIITVLFGALLLTGCSSSLTKYSMSSSTIGFDTFVSFTAYTSNETQFNNFSNTLKAEFKRYDKLFDKYNSYGDVANIKTINDNAGIKPVVVDKEIIELLTVSKKYTELSNRQFDITSGAVLNIWHEYREQGMIANKEGKESSIPTKEELEKANALVGWEHVVIDEANSTVFIKEKGVSLDVGGDAKGFAVEKIAQKLEKQGLEHAIINAGGNVRLIGDKPESNYWSVGVQIPNLKEESTDSLLNLKFDDSNSFVTSGDYQRYYTYKGEVMHHIIDPSTRMPARHSRAVTVVTKDSGIADILSTTLYTLSHEDGVKFLKELKEKEGIVAEAIWVYDDVQEPEDGTSTIDVDGYHVIVSDGLKDKVN